MTALGYGGVNIKTAFLTHLHSDHTVGYPDLIFTPWVMGRKEPLDRLRPERHQGHDRACVESLGGRHRRAAPTVSTSTIRTGWKVVAHEIAPGIVYRDSNVTVTAFPARHEEMVDFFSFRFDTPDRAIVISGDSAPTQAMLDHSHGCDVLIHEAYSLLEARDPPPPLRNSASRHHTSSVELADIANTVKPGLLITYHRSAKGEGTPAPGQTNILVEEIRRGYAGAVAAANDLDVF